MKLIQHSTPCIKWESFKHHVRKLWPTKRQNGQKDADYQSNTSRLLKLSHLSAHVVNRLLRENRKTIPKCLSGKTLLKNVTLQILNFIPVS